MSRIHPVLAIIAVVSAACSEPLAIAPEDLIGSWVEVQSLQPHGSMERTLTFHKNGSFVFRVEMTGIYGSSRGLDAYSELTGRFEASGGTLRTNAGQLEVWDSFYENPAPRVQPAPYSVFDNCTFNVSGDVLTLHYTSYPADAPVPTEMRLRRWSAGAREHWSTGAQERRSVS